jgi:hypothetical protein
VFRKADFRLVAAVLLLAIAALVFGQWLIAEPPISLSRDISPLNPRLFPSLVLFGLVVVAGFFIANRIRGTDEFETELEPALATDDAGGTKRLLGFLVLVVFSALALNTLGFLTTMFVLMLGTSLIVGNSNIGQILGFSAALPLLIYVLVTHVLRTALPELDAIEAMLVPLLGLLPSF